LSRDRSGVMSTPRTRTASTTSIVSIAQELPERDLPRSFYSWGTAVKTTAACKVLHCIHIDEV